MNEHNAVYLQRRQLRVNLPTQFTIAVDVRFSRRSPVRGVQFVALWTQIVQYNTIQYSFNNVTTTDT